MLRVIKIMSIVWVCLFVGEAQADDVTGAERLLCAAVQATACVDDGECGIDLPWNLNIPTFVEVDLATKRLSTTVASGENRITPIEYMSREDGVVVLYGYEMGRAFSWVIVEETGRTTVALAGDGVAVTVFGACTPVTEFERPEN